MIVPATGYTCKIKNRRISAWKKDNGDYLIQFRYYQPCIVDRESDFDFARTFFGRSYTIVCFGISQESYWCLFQMYLKFQN